MAATGPEQTDSMRNPLTLKFSAALFGAACVFNLAGCGGQSNTAPANSTAASKSVPDDDALRALVDKTLDFTQQRHMDSQKNAAWQIMHGLLAYGNQLKVMHNGKLVNTLDWLLNDGQMTGWNLRPADHGMDTLLESGSKTGQGHDDQWLAVLAQCGVPWDRPLIWQGKTYKMGDLVTQAQWDVRDGAECSWTIIGLSRYLPLDATWEAGDGQTWSIEKVVAMEAAQDLNASACGGTHRLIGMTMVLNDHLQAGGKLTGVWKDVDTKVREAIEGFKANQQPDGLFSSQYLVRPAATSDMALQINTSGHTLEFITIAATDKQLQEPWVRRAVVRVCDVLDITRDMPIECGALYHAAHALQIYRLRMWGPRSTQASPAPKPPAPSTPEEAPVPPPAPETASVKQPGV